MPAAVGDDVLPFLTVRDSQAPVIAAVNGICQAGGLLIAMLADIAVASDKATFRVPELLRGVPDATYVAVLPAHVGIAVARDLLFTGRPFDAPRHSDSASSVGSSARRPSRCRLRGRTAGLRTAPEARMHVSAC